MNKPDTLQRVPAEVQKRLRAGLASVPSGHPLLMAASSRVGDGVAVVAAVDVEEDAPAMASYRLPRLKTDMTFDASLVITYPDRIVDGAGELTNYVVHAYERELRRRIVAAESPTYVGLRGALPESGRGRVGGIDEMKHPGWQSQNDVGTWRCALWARDA